jgi:prepilin-type N-terminal cleavage/methylation domain-containing protein
MKNKKLPLRNNISVYKLICKFFLRHCTMTAKAFTLIELLVVVLIIGILAAIALPQYLLTVEKTRFAEMQLVTNSLAKELEYYKLLNGDYPPLDSWDTTCPQLNITYPGCTCLGSNFTCKNFNIDMYGGSLLKNLIAVPIPVAKHRGYDFTQWLQNSQYPGVKECCGIQNTSNEKLCKSFGGEFSRTMKPHSGWNKFAPAGTIVNCYRL